MRVISISTDRKLFEDDSFVLERNIEYSKKMEELHIIIFSLKKLGLKEKIIGNLHIYPTNSFSRWFYIFDAYRLGKIIIKNWKLEIGNSIGNVVVTSQDPFECGLVGFFLKKKFGFPLQLQSHTDFYSSHFRNNLLNIIRVWIAKFLIPKSDGFRVVSELIKNETQKRFKKLTTKIDVLPVYVPVEKIVNFIPTRDIKSDFPQFKFIIFMASRLMKEKRIPVAFEVLKKVLNQFSFVGLVIAGDGEERKNLEYLAIKMEISDNVRFIGWQDDLISYYKTANMFLLTSEYEGYGMTLVEAFASFCPIVTTEVGIAGNKNIFVNNKNSFVCPVGNIDCLFRATLEVIMSNQKREMFKTEMKNNLNAFLKNKDEYIFEYISLLENLNNKND